MLIKSGKLKNNIKKNYTKVNVYENNSFVEVSKKLNTDLKIILLDYQNNKIIKLLKLILLE